MSFAQHLPKPNLYRLRLVSGLILFAFMISHLLNHTLGLVSIDLMERARPFLSWQGPGGWVLVAGAALAHAALALWGLFARRHLRLAPWEAVQLVLGLAIPFLLVEHVLGTRISVQRFEIDPDYSYVQLVYWKFAPQYGVLQVFALIVAWVHAVTGMHFWLRLRPWYPRFMLLFFAGALLLPVTALLGFAVSGRQILIEAADPAVTDEILARVRYPGPHVDAFLMETADAFRIAFFGIIAGTLGLRVARSAWRLRVAKAHLTYPGSRIVDIVPGATVLEISRLNGIPHAAVCGGRGRCSTCRVRVGAGHEHLPPPTAQEARVLARIDAMPDIRLACQIRPSRSLVVNPLLAATADTRAVLRPGTHLEGREREVAVLFVDMRGFTTLAEGKLPYDVVFVLNRYFTELGKAVEDSGGRIDKFIGDGMMALFGVDGDAADGCRAALAAARSIGRRIDALNAALGSELPHPLDVAMALHVGTVIVGEMGYGRARSITAIGDAVNTTSRLEQVAKDHGVRLVVSRRVADRAGVDFGRFAEHLAAVRGRQEPILVHLVPTTDALPDMA